MNMKAKIILIIILITGTLGFSQSGINYKALIKDKNGKIIINTPIEIQFTILQDATNIYKETHLPTTDANGVVIVNIGEGESISGNFNLINWGIDAHYLNVQIDIGNGLVDLGTTQFMNVPYAKHANTAANVTGLETIDAINGKTNEIDGKGWRLIGQDANNYGNMGNKAVDLSHSDVPSNIYGATGTYAVALGNKIIASGDNSTSMGFQTMASGNISTAIGLNNVASGNYSMALGFGTKASGESSLSMGLNTEASGINAISMGVDTEASGYGSITMGNLTEASGVYSTAMGNTTIASGVNATAMGHTTVASGVNATAMGHATVASGSNATAMGNQTMASGENTTSMGLNTEASGDYTIAMGNQTIASGENATAMGLNTEASGDNSIATGYETIASGENATAMGNQTMASGENTTSMGLNTEASGLNAIAMGYGAKASGDNSIAIGERPEASGEKSLAIGHESRASGYRSRALGGTASGDFSVALGGAASGRSSFARGGIASGNSSFSLGFQINAQAYNQMVIGRYNIPFGNSEEWVATDPLFTIGNGTYDNRSDALTVLKNGNLGLGINTPDERLHIDGILKIGTETIEDTGSNQLSFNASLLPDEDSVMALGDQTYRWQAVWSVDGTINTSDRRDKTNIEPIGYGLDEVLLLNPVSFNWKTKSNNDTKLGLIAQNLLEIIPEVVIKPDAKGKNDRLGVYYADLIPVLIKAIQDQQDIINNQKLKVENLTSELAELKTMDTRIKILEEQLKTVE